STTLVFPSQTYDAGPGGNQPRCGVRNIRLNDGIRYGRSMRKIFRCKLRVDVEVGMGVTRRSRASSQRHQPQRVRPMRCPSMQHRGGDGVQVCVCSCGTGDDRSSRGGVTCVSCKPAKPVVSWYKRDGTRKEQDESPTFEASEDELRAWGEGNGDDGYGVIFAQKILTAFRAAFTAVPIMSTAHYMLRITPTAVSTARTVRSMLRVPPTAVCTARTMLHVPRYIDNVLVLVYEQGHHYNK
ncbi:hypothetical protein EV363DRAFT_1163929, partial [Boletus edulis]